MRIGINGFGRIGRLIFRIAHERGHEVVLVNDLTSNETLATLLKYDSNFGPFKGEVSYDDDNIIVDGRTVAATEHRNPADIPWADHGVDIVVESTGIFRKREQAMAHINAGAKKVLISAPSPDADFDIMVGVNEDQYDPQKHVVLSNASCTTNSLAAVMKLIDENFGIEQAMMTTVHSYTNDQNILDAPHKDIRRARSAATNIIPTSTGAAKAVGKVLPQLDGIFDGTSLRVPTPVGSVSDVTALLKREASADEINACIEGAAKGRLKGVVRFTTDPIVSSDIVGDPHSAIVDGQLTSTMGRMAKFFIWYDNEYGFSSRMVDVLELMAKDL